MGFMLDADAFWADGVTAENLLMTTRTVTLSKKAKDIFTTERHNGAPNQLGIDGRQGPRISKRYVRGPFRLMARPVVVQSKRGKHPLVGRIKQSSDPAEMLRPVRLVQLIHQILGFLKVSDPRKAVVLPPVPKALLVHPMGQPLASVHPHLNGKGKPGLDPYHTTTKISGMDAFFML
jgi:hypothetical protein